MGRLYQSELSPEKMEGWRECEGLTCVPSDSCFEVQDILALGHGQPPNTEIPLLLESNPQW